MARSGKKGSAAPPVSLNTEVPLPVMAPLSAHVPIADSRRPASRERIGTPRITIDNPWRDLHPTRVWPD